MQTFPEWIVSLSAGTSLGSIPKLSLEESSGTLGAGVTSQFPGLTDTDLFSVPLKGQGGSWWKQGLEIGFLLQRRQDLSGLNQKGQS